MKNSEKRYVFIIIPTIFILSMLLFFISCASKPLTIQMDNGKLRPCPQSPNCVSSESNNSKSQIKPFFFHGPPEKAWEILKESISSMGGNIQEERNDYLRAVFTSSIFRFKDDLECRIVPAEGIIHVRSGSRTGYSDLGVNEKRVEKLRLLFDELMKK